MTDDPAREVMEVLEAAHLDGEQLKGLVEEKARKYEGLSLEQLGKRWEEVMGRDRWASLDDYKAEVMALRRAMRASAEKRAEALRAGGFDVDEPMQ